MGRVLFDWSLIDRGHYVALTTYGWSDLDHNFHDVETLPEKDRTRYTISPDGRREVLRRLLSLNHERAAEEASQAEKKPVKKKGRGKKKHIKCLLVRLHGGGELEYRVKPECMNKTSLSGIVIRGDIIRLKSYVQKFEAKAA